MKRTGKIAVCGIVTALCTVVMLLTFINIATLAAPALAGFLLVVLVIEINWKWALLSYFAVTLLSFMTPDKQALLFFVVFLGYYPVVKSRIELLGQKWMRVLIKLLIFNAAGAVAYAALIFILGIPANPFESFDFLGGFVYPAAVIAANLIFVVYDIGMSRVIVLYCRMLHPAIEKILKRG